MFPPPGLGALEAPLPVEAASSGSWYVHPAAGTSLELSIVRQAEK
jgi:hypothetical protein